LVLANFAIPAHQLTVVTGPSGSGKTTVIDLVAGLLQPTSGEILVDGQPISDLDQRQWRRLIGYVPQEALLVNESVFYNLTLGDDTLTEADAHAALRMANAEHFIEQLEHGVHTPLGERGGRLSGGQRQRLAIARALIQQPKLLILDEATSNLDASSEQAIIETVDQLKGQLTLLAVSHDRPMIDIADQHIKLLGGQRQ
jgi:ATP-binding cassette subfamily C protein